MKKNKVEAEEYGVVIERIQAVTRGRKRKFPFELFVGLLLFILLQLGMAECLITGFEMQVSQKWIVAGVVVSSMLLYTGFSWKQRGEFLVGAYLLAYAGVSFWKRKYIANGLAVFMNAVLKVASTYYSVTFVEYEEKEGLDPVTSLTIFLLFVFTFLIGVLAYLFVHRWGLNAGFVLSFCIAFAPEVVGLVPGKLAITAYVLAVLGFAGSRMDRRIRGGQVHKVQWKIRLIQLLFGMVALGTLAKVCSESKYDEIARDSDFKTFVQKVIQRQYNNTLRSLLDDGSVNGGISFGSIDGIDKLEYTDEVKLRLKFHNLGLEGQGRTGLYLRGYVGSMYEDNNWKSLDATKEEKRQQLEDKHSIALDDYDTAAVSYRMKLEDFMEYHGADFALLCVNDCKDYRQFGQKFGKEYWMQNYDTQQLKKQMETIGDDDFLVDYTVENVGETVSTQFVPYYAMAPVEEQESGRLLEKEVDNIGEYTFSVNKLQVRKMGAVTGSLYDCLGFGMYDNFNKMRLVWKEFLEIKDIVEKDLQMSVLDYKEGTYHNNETIEDVSEKLWEDLLITYNFSDEFRTDCSGHDSWEKYNQNLEKLETAEIGDGNSMEDIRYCEVLGGLYGGTVEELYDKEISDSEKAKGDVFRAMALEADADAFLTVLKNTEKFFLQQQEYERFVKEAYLEVPDELKKQLEQLLKENKIWEQKNVVRIASYIQSYLYYNAEYSLEPGRTPEGKDFVSYFLFENKKGYCSHYASAATMLFRTMGIPARYVEGYYANRDMMAGANKTLKDGQYESTLELTDKNAHAWVEIYLSGYGWVPVEVTKSYLNSLNMEGFKTENKPMSNHSTPNPSKTSDTPTVSKTPQSNTGTDKKIDVKNNETKHSYGIYLGIAGGVLAVIALLVFHYQMVQRKKIRKGSLEKQNEACYFYYQQMEHMVRILKQCGTHQTLREQLLQDGVEISGMEEEDWKHLLQCMNSYAFSKEGVSVQEARDVQELYEQLRTAFYAEKRGIKALYYKYIRCI